MALAFEKGELRILPDLVLVGELQAYEAERLPSGMLRYSAPHSLHDGCVMALAIGWSCARGSTCTWTAEDIVTWSVLDDPPPWERPLPDTMRHLPW